jgi:hypothetical protein
MQRIAQFRIVPYIKDTKLLPKTREKSQNSLLHNSAMKPAPHWGLKNIDNLVGRMTYARDLFSPAYCKYQTEHRLSSTYHNTLYRLSDVLSFM